MHLGYTDLQEILKIDIVIAMDVSADLPELSKCPVGLVSAGVKSILDIGRYENLYLNRCYD